MTRVRGWCPTAHAPMPTGDGLLLRVRPPLGRLSAEGARLLADAGHPIELTARGALQLRALSPGAAARVLDALVAAGLAPADPAADAAPPVLLSPLAGADPGAHPHALPLARALSDALVADPALRRLPPKALLAVDAGGALPLGIPSGADLVLRPDPAGALLLLPGARARLAAPVDAILAAVLALLRLWAGAPPPVPRLRALDPAALLRALGLAPEPHAAPPGPPPGHAVGPVSGTDSRPVALGLAPPLSRLSPDALRRLADLAARHGDGLLRLTPWRSILLAGLPAAIPPALRDIPGLLTDPADPLLRLVACPGAPACASGQAPTLEDAAALAPLLPPGPSRLHLSGCAKGCAHPAPAPTLVARAGRYDLVRHGRAGDAPDALALTPAEAVRLLA